MPFTACVVLSRYADMFWCQAPDGSRGFKTRRASQQVERQWEEVAHKVRQEKGRGKAGEGVRLKGTYNW